MAPRYTEYTILTMLEEDREVPQILHRFHLQPLNIALDPIKQAKLLHPPSLT